MLTKNLGKGRNNHLICSCLCSDKMRTSIKYSISWIFWDQELKSCPWEKNKLVSQCKICQAYGHMQKYCFREPRSVKFTGKPLTKDCKKPASSPPKCVHCSKNHPDIYCKTVRSSHNQGTVMNMRWNCKTWQKKEYSSESISSQNKVHGNLYVSILGFYTCGKRLPKTSYPFLPL